MNSDKKYGREYIGKEFTTNEGYIAKVIEGGTKNKYCTIQIEDWVKEVQVSHIKRGEVKYPYHPSVFNIGYMGVGSYSKKNHKDIYSKWQHILQRCYDPKYQERQPTYKGVTVCTEWYNFQNFAKWMGRYHPKDGLKYELDKDLKSDESKIYSPQTCVFIPQALNSFMTNVKLSNTSGRIGVSWYKNTSKWRVTIKIDGKNKSLGYFTDVEEANKIYQIARKEQVERWKRYYSFDYPKHILNRLR